MKIPKWRVRLISSCLLFPFKQLLPFQSPVSINETDLWSLQFWSIATFSLACILNQFHKQIPSSCLFCSYPSFSFLQPLPLSRALFTSHLACLILFPFIKFFLYTQSILHIKVVGCLPSSIFLHLSQIIVSTSPSFFMCIVTEKLIPAEVDPDLWLCLKFLFDEAQSFLMDTFPTYFLLFL